jgi:enterochelin esterase family protein
MSRVSSIACVCAFLAGCGRALPPSPSDQDEDGGPTNDELPPPADARPAADRRTTSGSVDAGTSVPEPPADGGAGDLPPTVTTTVTDPGSEGDGDFKIGPTYAPAPEYTPKPGVPTGSVVTFQMKSADSKFFTGLNGAFTRNVAVYVPKQYVPGTPAPFIVAQDGKNWVPRLSATLDNLINDHKLPVMIAICVDNGGGDSKGSERGLEYDTVSGKYAEFVNEEVLPRVELEAKVKLTSDPEGRATLGGSSGGAAAFSMGWFHPELFRRVLTYSGTYVNQQSPTSAMYPHGAWEYHEHLIPQSEPKPLRVWLEAGSNDNGAGSSAGGLHNWVLANQNMAKVLAAKHYHYRFEYAQGAGHVDGKAVSQTLPEAMLWLWRGYPLH